MIIFFEGPDKSRKTTLAKSIAKVLDIPFWERGTYLPHHHSNTSKLEGKPDVHLHRPEALWYVIDELKTLEVFKALGGNVIVDRHPLISECVFRRLEGKPSKLEITNYPTNNEAVVFCHNGVIDDVAMEYKRVLGKLKFDYLDIDTSKGEEAIESIIESIYQIAPGVR